LFQYLCVLLFSSEILIQAFSQPLGYFYEPSQVKLGREFPQLTNSKKGELKWKANAEISGGQDEQLVMFL
jgi:hypothetical protein